MAAGNEDTEVSLVKDDDGECSSSDEDWNIDEDEVNDDNKQTTGLSLFCRNCLCPYVGELTSVGQIVLRCKQCDHTDIVTDDMLGEDEDLETLKGDIITNKFRKILNFEKEIKKIDMHDPFNVGDDFRWLHEIHARILKVIIETTNDIRAIVDSHRMAHNMWVYKDRQLILSQLENSTLSRTKIRRERAKAWHVEVTGSLEENNFIIDPQTFSVPREIGTKITHLGKKGVLTMDKMLLTVGLPNVFIKDNMPLYSSRLQRYRNGIRCKYGPESGNTECSCDINIQSTKLEYKISDDEILCEDDEHVLLYTFKDNTEMCAFQLPFPSRLNTDENDNEIYLSLDVISSDVQGKEPRSATLQNGNVNSSAPTSGASVLSQKETVSMLECLCLPPECMEEIDREIVVVTESIKAAMIKHASLTPADPDLDYQLYLGVTDFGSDYQEHKFILRHMDKVECDDVTDYTIDYVHRTCAEVENGVRKRKSDAKEERRLRIDDYLQQTAARMHSRVDTVTLDVMNQLKVAYKAKQSRKRKKIKLMEEKMERMQILTESAKKSQDSDDIYEVMDVLKQIKEWNKEN